MKSALRIAAFGTALALSLGSCEDPVVDVDRGLQLVWLTPPPETLREGDPATVAVQVLDRDGQAGTDFDGATVALTFTFEADSQPGMSCAGDCIATVAQGQVSMTVNWLSAGSWTARACVTPPAGGDELCAERPVAVLPVQAVLVVYPSPSVERRVPFAIEARLQLPNGDAVTDIAPTVRLRFTSPAPETPDRLHCPEAGPVCERVPAEGVARLDQVVIFDLATTTLEACVIAPNGHERCDPAGPRTFNVVLPQATLHFLTEPSGGSVAVPFPTQPVIEVLEPDGTRRADFAGLITVALTANQTGALLAGTGVGGVTSYGTVSQPASGGLATFTGIRLTIARPSSTLDASADGATTATSASFAVTLDPAQLSIIKEAGDAQYGLVGTQLPVDPTVLVTGPLGEPITGVLITFSVAGGGSLTHGSASTGLNGRAPAGAWTLGPDAGLNTITATAAGFTPAVFSADGVVPMRLGYITPPSDIVAGDIMSPVVIELRDIQQRRIFGATDEVTVVGPGGVQTAHAAVDGRATFNDLTYTVATPAGATTSLHATGARPGPQSVFVSPGFRVLPRVATASMIHIAGINQTAPVGTAVAVRPAVRVYDIYGNAIAGRQVTFSATAGDGAVTDPQQTTDAEGEARPTAWTLGPLPGANTLTVTVLDIEGFITFHATGTSDPIVVERFALISAPVSVTAGQIMDPIVVELQDNQGRRALGASNPIRIFFPDPDPEAPVDAVVIERELPAVDGRVTFDDLSITRAGTFVFYASTEVISVAPDLGEVTVTPDLATILLENAGGGDTATVGFPVLPPPRVRLRDQYGNGIGGRTVTFASLGTGSVTGPEQVTNSAGYASPTAWTLGSIGFNFLNASVDGLPSIAFVATGLAPAFRVSVISAGFDFTCATGRTVARFDTTFGGDGGVIAVDTVDVPQSAYCWGNNNVGQLGDGTQTPRSQPTELAGGLLPMSQVSAPTAVPFFSFACGLAASNGAAYCWGVNHNGQIGIGAVDGDLHATPVAVHGGHAFQQIGTGAVHACGLDGGGAAWCWGFGNPNALGRDPTEANPYEPGLVYGLHTFTQLAVGGFHACGLTGSGEVWCWGSNDDGQLGIDESGTYIMPQRVSGGRSFTQISAGAFHTCGVSGGSVYCWGHNGVGELGTGDFIQYRTPTLVPGVSSTAQQVSAGGNATCAVTSSGEAYCWGSNSNGQLGDGTLTGRPSAARVGGTVLFRSITTGAFHTCALRQDGAAYCWGSNTQGRLGNGTVTQRTLPTAVIVP